MKDRLRDIPTILGTLRQLAALPAVEPKRLIELASDDRPAVQEAALRALGGLDAGQGVPALLTALGDDRARVAIYALRASLLEMPPARALPLLRKAPLDKVTVAKEYVRLLGDLPGDEAFAELRRLDGETLHRDVRVALLRALWTHLERDDAWPILERALASSDPALMTSVIRIPAEHLSEKARRRLVALLAGVLDHPDATVRVQLLQRCAILPLADPEQRLLPRFLAALRSRYPEERQAASQALWTTAREADAGRVADAVRELLTQRRSLAVLLRTLCAFVGSQRQRLVPLARAVLAVLESDPWTATLRIELALTALNGEEAATLLERLAARKEFHADAITAAVTVLLSWPQRPDRADLQKLELRLSKGDESLRRLALAALQAQSQLPGGWSAERLARLQHYRQDAAVLVAAAAQFTLPHEEETIGEGANRS